ncbi:MAG TPA: cell division protein ZapA [Nitrosomonas nitrosa]|uniref:Cell division protein ZapA n=1 Tax=Nitrosomonas nitrosa TaxID=52442 RepID=A0A8H9DA30_9PROT|nr:cell division protein ZapA [Nitrosomonas nitrosa]MCO6433769.1 cell division protein ZapA [Nitrosomonas nitrosa]CAE6486164.1 Cell division protein ZapA [Nitrosomonas nitrosa]HBZ31119.1 cell division protein ZapA [Nitrosomonas nitrosa]HNP50918.1 cell division protein ZapA [Nitrosomonas nitrosa]
MSSEKSITVKILGCEFSMSCTKEEREGLLYAVSYLDQKIQHIKNEGKIVGNEQIAIVAALQIARELLTLRSVESFDMSEFKRRIKIIESKLDELLPRKES